MSTRRKIQLLLWAYFWLLIFEGALRKWVFPGLSTPLLVIRDPIAISAVLLGLPYLTKRPWAGWFGWFLGIGGVAVFLALVAGHRDIVIALYGARILWCHLPLIFLFACVFTRDDVYSFVKATAFIAILMAVVIGMQYSLPQSHFINVAPGGEEGLGIRGALGKFRPPGTFSFANGLSEFYGLAAACVSGLLVSGFRPLPKWLWLSVPCLMFALPVSISRTLFFKYVIVGIATAVAIGLSGRNLKRLGFGVLAVLAAVLVAGFLPIVSEARKAFAVRWEEAAKVEAGDRGVAGVLDKRIAGYTIDAVAIAWDTPILGRGIGLATNVGAMRTKGKRAFLFAEGAWPSTIGELGPILGLTLLAVRLALAAFLVLLAVRQSKVGNLLPLVMGGFALFPIVMGDTAQPTALGFLVVGAGLMLAACNPTKAELLKRRTVLAANSQSASVPRSFVTR
jgi:hypothetical protein